MPFLAVPTLIHAEVWWSRKWNWQTAFICAVKAQVAPVRPCVFDAYVLVRTIRFSYPCFAMFVSFSFVVLLFLKTISLLEHDQCV